MKVHVVAFLLIALSSIGLFAQQQQGLRAISARVVDRTNGEPLMFATVRSEDNGQGTMTDENGLFSMEISGVSQVGRSHLLISYLGYQTTRFRVPRRASARVYTIRLSPTNFELADPPVIRSGKGGSPPVNEERAH
ncbi:MAG: carboxypeptidase-like regulatory domain-containing protein [Flavobacteriales bacterium]|nr:carboxypeptidase-like regulatory domain-containing protein [Flavobacteriales bacterium]